MSTPTDDHRSPEPSTHRPQKRRRGIACTECRDRKIRCDGSRPICDSCSRRNLPLEKCVYADPERPEAAASNSNQYVKELEKRVHELEATIQTKSSSPGKLDNTFRTPGLPSIIRNRTVSESASVARRPIHLAKRGEVAIGENDDEDDKDSNNDPQELPLGGSSVSGFIKQAHETLERRGSSKAASSSHDDGSRRTAAFSPEKKTGFSLLSWQSRPRSQQTLSSCVASVMLPSRDLCNVLLQAFWDYEYELMPLFHRPKFMQRYQQMWESSDAEAANTGFASIYEKASFYCLLCGVLALSYRNTPLTGLEPAESEASGAALMERAKQLLYAGLLEGSSVEVVQAIIFIAMYQRRMGNHHESWIFIGLASRVAQALGFHYATEDGSQAEREARKRTWYGCVILDSMHTTVFGQAPISAGATLPPPNMIDDIYMETDAKKSDREQPKDAIPEIAFFIYTTKLSGITVNILRSIYNTGHPSLKDIPAVEFRMSMLTHDSELQAWKNDLPPYLRIENKDQFPDERRQRTLLYMRVRYLDCRFLLFRAAVLRLAARPASELSVLQEGVIRANLDSCISSIRELLDIFGKYRQTHFIPGPKHNVVCLLTAATVLALMVRSQFLSTFAPEEGAYAQLLNDCMKTLRSYDRVHFPMRRKGAADAIERLMNVSTPADTHDRVAQFAQQQSAANAAAAAQAPDQMGRQDVPNIATANKIPDGGIGTTASSSTLQTSNGATPFGAATDPNLPLGPPQMLPMEDMDLFTSADFLGDLTGDLQNPATWVPNEMDPFGMGFPGAYDMQNLLGAPGPEGIPNMGVDGAGTAWYGQQYNTPWWQPTGQ